VLGIWHDVDAQLKNETSLKGLGQVEEAAHDKLINAQTEILRKEAELAEAKQKLDEMAYTDTLTNLPNRRHLDELLVSECQRTHRTKREFSICIADLDDFKKINDGYGHDMGDLVLKEVADIFTKSIRVTDTVGRWGGEEFIFILPETPVDGAIIFMERVRQGVMYHRFIKGDVELNVTVTLGAAGFVPEDNLETVIKHADLALYAGKKSGKNIAVEYKKQLEVIHSIYI
jgi:diguanylate cyclase (GGDEF)-like protein